MTKNAKTVINTIVFLTIGVALFYWTIGNQDLDSIWSKIKTAHLEWIILSMICGILSHLARALRWNLLLEPLGYRASPIASFHAVILGYLVNMALPRVGEVTRPAVLSKVEKIPFNKLMGTVVVERVVDLVITALIGISIFFIQFSLIADFFKELFSQFDTKSAIYSGIGLVVFLLLILFVYLKRKWFYSLPVINKFKDFIEGVLDGFKTIFNLNQKGLFIFYSLFIWLMYLCMPLFVFYALDGTSHLGLSAGLTVLLFGTAAMIVPVPGGVGTFEVMVPSALALYGIGGLVASSYTLITHAIQFLVIIGVGITSIIYFIIKTNKSPESNVE